METSSLADLQHKYKAVETERLVKMLAFNELTDLAKDAAVNELMLRNIDIDSNIASLRNKKTNNGSNWRWLLVPFSVFVGFWIAKLTNTVFSYFFDFNKTGVFYIFSVISETVVGFFCGLLSMYVLPKTSRNALTLKYIYVAVWLFYCMRTYQTTVPFSAFNFYLIIANSMFALFACIGIKVVMKDLKE